MVPLTFTDCPHCPAMVVVAPGRFEMGSSAAERRSYGVPAAIGVREGPRHPVTIAYRYAIARDEVTVADFTRFISATKRRGPRGCSVYLRRTDSFVYRQDRDWRRPSIPTSPQHPVTCVSWEDANAYAAWLSAQTGQRYRLPSEAEWEYAARAGTDSAAWWGDSAENACANARIMNAATDTAMHHPPSWRGRLMCSAGGAWTAPIGSYSANPWGLRDMIGNVWEWAADCAGADYRDASADGSARIVAACPERSIRGGAFHSAPYFARAASRGFGKKPDYRSFAIGFRLVREMAPDE